MAQRSRSNFRVRPLDPYKVLPVYRDAGVFEAIQEEEDSEEDGNKQVIESSQSTSDGNADKKKKKSSPPSSVPGTLTEQLKVDKGKSEEKQFNLPVPETAKSSTFDRVVPGTFRVENAYIRHRIKYHDDYNLTGDVEFQMTTEDEEWLNAHPKYGPKGKHTLAPSLFERIIDAWERKTGRDFPMNQREAVVFVQNTLDLNLAKDNRVLEDVYGWWIQRRTKLRKPLLRRFWPVTAPNDTSPNLTFRPREKERYRLRKKRQNDLDSLEKMTALRNDFEMLRLLLELVRRREHLHEVQAKLLEDEFEQSIWEITQGNNASRDVKDLIAPIELPPGPLENDEVDAVYDTNRTVQPASIQIISHDNSMSEASSEFSRLEAEERKLRKSKKIKKKQPVDSTQESIVQARNVENTPANANPKVAQQPQQLSQAKENAPKPFKPPRFLLDPSGPQYLATEWETSHPIVPTWPPSQSSLLEIRRKQSQQQSVRGGFSSSVRRSLHGTIERPRYRCRPRIGRGGRFLIDRIPVSISAPKYRPVKEIYAGPNRYGGEHNFLDPCRTRDDTGSELTPTSAVMPVLGASQMSKVQSIYTQDDSEDEDVTILDYPYLPALQLSCEDESWLNSVGTKHVGSQPKETKFRFIIE